MEMIETYPERLRSDLRYHAVIGRVTTDAGEDAYRVEVYPDCHEASGAVDADEFSEMSDARGFAHTSCEQHTRMIRGEPTREVSFADGRIVEVASNGVFDATVHDSRIAQMPDGDLRDEATSLLLTGEPDRVFSVLVSPQSDDEVFLRGLLLDDPLSAVASMPIY